MTLLYPLRIGEYLNFSWNEKLNRAIVDQYTVVYGDILVKRNKTGFCNNIFVGINSIMGSKIGSNIIVGTEV